MVYKIVQSKYRIFVESLILTVLILIIGFSIGIYLESSRTNKIIQDYKNFEVSALDLKLQNYYYQVMDSASCDLAIQQNFIFADRIYNEGLTLEKYEKANELTNDIVLEKKRYVLLKTELWLNSMVLKKKCNIPFHTLVYLYAHNADMQKDAEQASISDILKEVKDSKGNQVILIPIAGDMGLDVVDMQLNVYNVTYLPSILIDEKTLLEGYHSAEEIQSYLN